jgi:predicted  nucleic acid-binding Zn-ribbon protein
MFQDDYKTELGSMKNQMVEAQENQNKIESKLNSLQVAARNLQDEKNALESKLMHKQTLLQGQVCNDGKQLSK